MLDNQIYQIHVILKQKMGVGESHKLMDELNLELIKTQQECSLKKDCETHQSDTSDRFAIQGR